MNEQSRRTVLVEPTAADAIRLVAELIAAHACDAVARRGQFTLALSGGSTPKRLYEYLAMPAHVEDIPWPNAQIFFGDERDVPHDQPDSNYRMAQESLLGAVPVQYENIHPMNVDVPDLDLSARQYADLIRQIVPPGRAGIPSFDFILLGMGGDGHTASLFPDTPALHEDQKLIVAQFVPVLGRRRMTFTYPLINAAELIIFLVTGLDKAEALAHILSPHPAQAAALPAGRIAPLTGKIMYVLDADAASRTSYRARKG